jgi:short-subunit dehydrogenase
LVERAEAEVGPVDIVVNNAGAERAAAFADLEAEEIAGMIDLNLTSAMLLTLAVLPGMVARGRGHVVNIASAAGKVGCPFAASYSATKFGLVGATQALRAEHHGSPVGFSVICPGFVRDDGMYARYEVAGVRAPLFVGTTTPQKVAKAVLTAITHDRAEVIVNSSPLRPMVVLGTAFPNLAAPLMRYLGLKKMLGRAAEIEVRHSTG